MKNHWILSMGVATAAFAHEGKIDTQGDWMYACDNTGTCRMAGYQSEEAQGNAALPPPVSVLLMRAAGADAPLTGEVAVLPDGEKSPFPEALTLSVNGKEAGKVADVQDGRGKLSADQAQAIVDALRDGKGEVGFSDGKAVWKLSANGAGFAFLGADDFQKRIGTPSALASPGKNEGALLAPEAVPVIKAAAVTAGTPEVIKPDDAAYAPLLALFTEADLAYSAQSKPGDEEYPCHFFEDGEKPESDLRSIAVYPVDKDHVLAVTACELGAYNAMLSYALMPAGRKEVRQYLRLVAYGDLDYAEMPPYQDGEISELALARGIGDCSWQSKWVWDGKAFVRTSGVDTGLCRGFSGGAWTLPVFVSEVQKP